MPPCPRLVRAAAGRVEHGVADRADHHEQGDQRPIQRQELFAQGQLIERARAEPLTGVGHRAAAPGSSSSALRMMSRAISEAALEPLMPCSTTTATAAAPAVRSRRRAHDHARSRACPCACGCRWPVPHARSDAPGRCRSCAISTPGRPGSAALAVPRAPCTTSRMPLSTTVQGALWEADGLGAVSGGVTSQV